MPTPIYITGPAGSGKTFTLLNKSAEFGRTLISEDHHRLLAITFMHGSRQRLDSSLGVHNLCSKIRRTVSTIDGFALQLVNQWRTTLGFSMPAYASSLETKDAGHPFGVQLTYDRIVSLAASLLSHRAIRITVANTYPLVVVDEFQDCTGDRLKIITELADFVQVIAAADPFQQLNCSGDECPATSWIENLSGSNVSTIRLSRNERTKKQQIINAALSLRSNRRTVGPSVSVMEAPRGRGNTLGLVAAKILYTVVAPKRGGTTAVIFPSNIAESQNLIQSLAKQCSNKDLSIPKCSVQSTTEDEFDSIKVELGCWVSAIEKTQAKLSLGADAAEALSRAESFSLLRGHPHVDEILLHHFAGRVLHSRRAFAHQGTGIIFTTIHGAKNREFDHVFIIWGYRNQVNLEQQRRLLYNAVTRAKDTCIVLDTRKSSVIAKDPLMQLLGGPEPIFKPKKKIAFS